MMPIICSCRNKIYNNRPKLVDQRQKPKSLLKPARRFSGSKFGLHKGFPTLQLYRMHGEFLRLLFLQAHRETTAHFIATRLPWQQNRSDNAFRFKRAAFYMGLKKNLNIQGCSVVAPSLHALSHAPLLLPSFFHTISLGASCRTLPR